MTIRGLSVRGFQVSALLAVVGVAGLSACGSDSDGGGAVAGEAGEANVSGGAGKAPTGGGAGKGSGGGGMDSAAGMPGGGTAGEPEEGGMGGALPSMGGVGADAGEAGMGPVPPPHPPEPALTTLSPLPAVPADTTNAYADNALARALGQKLFFDKRYSGALKQVSDLGAIGDVGKVACFSCHSSPALADNRSTPNNVTLGTDFHTRNAPPLVNSSYYVWTNWAGRFSAQWELPLAVAENPITMNSTRLTLAHFIFDHYKTEYEAIFGAMEAAIGTDAVRFPATGKPKALSTDPDGAWEGMAAGDKTIVNRIGANYGKLLEAYMRQLVNGNAPFDQWVAGTDHAVSESAKRGAELFAGKGRCLSCHNGPDFTDNQFHNLGVPQTGAHVPATDDGRFKDAVALLASPINSGTVYSDDINTGRLLGLTTPMPSGTKSQFRTASLRNIAQTAPYMHAGQLNTLADVVSFYNAGGGTPATGTLKDSLLFPLGLSASEQLDLVAFLNTLTGSSVSAALLVDTSGQ